MCMMAIMKYVLSDELQHFFGHYEWYIQCKIGYQIVI